MATEDPFHHLHDEGYAALYRAGFVGAQTLIQRGGRPSVSLDGEWRLTLDLFDEGLRQKWFELDESDPSQWPMPRDYEIAAGEQVRLPHCWNLEKPEWTFFEGAGWYTRHFEHVPDPARPRCVLQFGGANYAAYVFVNGRFAGAHRGGSTPFSIEITGFVRPGSNRLQVMVENRRTADRVPMRHFDWFNYGGLYREIELLALPRTFIRRAFVRLVPGSGFRRIAVDVWLSEEIEGPAVLRIPSLGIVAEIAVRAGHGRLELEAAPALWSLEAPVLHMVEIRFGEDVWRERIGFREIRAEGTNVLINGEPVWLKGACVHEDDLALGKVATEADIRRRFRHGRELGANFLRLAHYPHHELVARIADEQGLLLWAEIPVYWAIDFANADTNADAANQLQELIFRDSNRASIILWGVGNENADTDARHRFMADLARLARELDPTRLITAACLINRESFRIEDRLADALDVIGLNEYFGWYEPDVANFERLVENTAAIVSKPVIISETGADALAGKRGAGRVLFSEDWQAEFYRLQFGVIANTPWIRGVAVWLLYDFRSERRQTSFQRGFNRKGLIAEDKQTKKQAFAAIRELFDAIPPEGPIRGTRAGEDTNTAE